MTAERHWRVPGKVPAGKLAAAAIVALVGLLASLGGAGDLGGAGEVGGVSGWWGVGVAAAASAGLVAWAVRDLVVPVRLAADSAGLTVVTGFGTRHRLDWSRVERVRVDVRRRSRMLEVDVGDQLYLFSRYDVDADLDNIVAELEHLRRSPG